MRRHLALLAAVAATLFAAPSPVVADSSPKHALGEVRYLVGTWTCRHTVGDFSGTYRTSFSTALEGEWLKQRYDFPATKDTPAWYGEFFFGYDGRVPRWVRFGAMSTGQYFGMVSKDAGVARITWQYRLPGAGSATWTKRSDSEFSIEGPSYPENGKLVTEHHVCRKAS
jgi:hypothetical protein